MISEDKGYRTVILTGLRDDVGKVYKKEEERE